MSRPRLRVTMQLPFPDLPRAEHDNYINIVLLYYVSNIVILAGQGLEHIIPLPSLSLLGTLASSVLDWV